VVASGKCVARTFGSDALEVGKIDYAMTVAAFVGVDDEIGRYLSVNSASNVSPARLPAPLRDRDSAAVAGRLPWDQFLAALKLDVFEPRAWIMGRYHAGRFLGVSERTVRRRLEREDERFALRVGWVRLWPLGDLEEWFIHTYEPRIRAERSAAASLPRGIEAARRRLKKVV
jgi:hypothetical protein